MAETDAHLLEIVTLLQIYTIIRPAQLKQAVSLYEEPARRMLENVGAVRKSMFEEHLNVPRTRSEFP